MGLGDGAALDDQQDNTRASDARRASLKVDNMVDDSTASDGATDGRRDFLKKSIKTAAFVAPVVLFFKPSEAVAGSGGSLITPGP